jgi:hypothetical protein
MPAKQAAYITRLARKRFCAVGDDKNKGNLTCDVYKSTEVTLGIQDITDGKKRADEIEGKRVQKGNQEAKGRDIGRTL